MRSFFSARPQVVYRSVQAKVYQNSDVGATSVFCWAVSFWKLTLRKSWEDIGKFSFPRKTRFWGPFLQPKPLNTSWNEGKTQNGSCETTLLLFIFRLERFSGFETCFFAFFVKFYVDLCLVNFFLKVILKNKQLNTKMSAIRHDILGFWYTLAWTDL